MKLTKRQLKDKQAYLLGMVAGARHILNTEQSERGKRIRSWMVEEKEVAGELAQYEIERQLKKGDRDE